MPEIAIKIAGRAYTVACNPGEEDSLEKAAQLLSMEADAIAGQLGTLPEQRLLLMAGLMLGDRTVGVYGELEKAQAALKEVKAQLGGSQDSAALAEATARAEAAEAALERATVATEQLAMDLGTS
ncbi:MAG: cell division protein ZapA [Pseudomonadota bacterium]